MRILNGGFIGLFMIMSLLPLVFVDLSSDRVSVKENRRLADPPKPVDLKNLLIGGGGVTLIRQFDAWFKDSTGFREQLLALYNAIDFNTKSGVKYGSGEDSFIVGEQGHHFWIGNDGNLIRKFQGKPILSDEQLADMAKKLEEIRVYLEKKGIAFIVMFCTRKEEIYPEYYPKSIKRGPEPILLDLTTNYIKEHTNVDVFNIRRALLAVKNNYMLYPVFSGDLHHYNEIAAFFAYRELMKHINIYFPEITPYSLNDIEIRNKVFLNETIELDVSLKTYNYKIFDQSFFDDVELQRPFLWENTAYENENVNLPVILVFRDSYSGYFYNGYFGVDYEKKFITQFIASNFGRAIFIHYSNLKNFEKYVDKYNPDIIVFESVSPEIIASNVAEVPELLTVYGRP